MKRLKVYGWQGWRLECKTHHHATREICAAPSGMAVARAMGEPRPSRLFNFCETGNAREIERAMSRPGVVFWKPLDDYKDDDWTAVEPQKDGDA